MNSQYEKTTLANGVRLILVPMVGVNSVATSVMVAVGSRYETKENNGVSHFLEHLVFKGTAKYPTSEDIYVIERAGGLQNAYTDIDITSYHNKVIASDWELALNINTEMALHPRLEETYVDKERDIILEEMKRSDDEPSSKVGEIYQELMYPGTPLGMRIIGEVKSLKSIAPSTLRDYHEAWYRPPQMVVSIAGAISDKRQVTSKIEEWFGSLKGKPEHDFKKVTNDSQNGPRVAVVTKKEAQQAHLLLGLRTFPRGNDDRFAWNLFNLIMGVSFTSRLFREVREKRGLCYHVRSSSDSWADVGYWSIYAGVATDKVEEATKAILFEVGKVAREGVTDSEVAVAKKRLKTMLAFNSENPEFMGEFYARQETFRQPIVTLDDFDAKIEAVTKDDINTLAKKYLLQKNLNMALVWSKPKDEKLADLLRL
ncbi:MAG TPA: pitrilysin family protein [Patescibacteria group bacterium]|nr:pitrilysin family protein [Patescibacteria group bacterium]